MSHVDQQVVAVKEIGPKIGVMTSTITKTQRNERCNLRLRVRERVYTMSDDSSVVDYL